MKLRTYLTLLRPGRTALIGGFYTLMATLWAKTLFHLDAPLDRVAGCAFVAPVLWGALLVGPLHEVMHRSMAIALPGLVRRLRSCHLRGTLVVAAALVFVQWRLIPSLPLPAALGFTFTGLAVPAYNRRKRVRVIFRLWLVGTFVGLMVICSLMTGVLYHWALTSPWVIFLIGGALYAGALWVGFDPRDLRRRANDPVYCFQTMFLNRDIMLEANRAAAAKMATRSQDLELSVRDLRWDGSLLACVRVMHLVRFRRRILRQLTFMAIVPATLSLGMMHLMNWAVNRGMSFRDSIASLGEIGPSGLPFGSKHPFGVIFMIVPVITFAVAVFASQTQRWSMIPVSRRRLANCHFIYTLITAAAVNAATMAATAGVLVAAAALSGAPMPGAALTRMAGLFLFLLPLLPLSFCVAMFSRAWMRIATATIGGLGVIFGGVAYFGVRTSDWFTPAVTVTVVVMTVVCFAVYWWYLRRIYATRDLDHVLSFSELAGAA